MSSVPWIKVLTDIFSDEKIQIIQSMPEGDSLTVMWFKLLAQAGKTNDGGYIYLKRDIPYSPAMLATLFGKSQQIVELALRTFQTFGMIEIDDQGYIFLSNWEKHQNIDALDKIRDNNRLRQQRHREKKLLEKSNVSVTLPSHRYNALEEDIDKELDKDKENKDMFISTEIEQHFESWWKSYPNKGSKKTALASFKKEKAYLDLDKLHKGTQAYITFQTKKGYDICMGATFLNQRRWEGEWVVSGTTGRHYGGVENESSEDSEATKRIKERLSSPGVF